MTKGLTFIVELERAKHKLFSQVMNGVGACVELDCEIVKQTSLNASSLAFNVATAQFIFERS